MRCRSCDASDPSPILSLGLQALSYFLESNKKPKKFPLDLVLCDSCHLLQLKHTVSQKLLYTENYGYRSGINRTMQNELKEIVKKAQKKISPSREIIALDIGANDGTLLSFYPKSIYTVGIEPIKKLAEACKMHANVVINDFFSFLAYKRKLSEKKAHIITAISCFYDIEQPNEFVSDIAKILEENGVFVIQQNYLVGMLEQNAFDNIVHEHLEYYSLLSLENLLKKHSLEVFDVEKSDINGGSFRTYVSHAGQRRIHKSVLSMRKAEKRLKLESKEVYRQFAKRVKKNAKALHQIIQKLVDTGKTIFVYGASTRGNTLLQYYKLDNKLITAAVERNPEKWGKRIASVGIPIISEEEGRIKKPDYMLVLPWFFREEFLDREREYLKNGGHFIFPLPRPEII